MLSTSPLFSHSHEKMRTNKESRRRHQHWNLCWCSRLLRHRLHRYHRRRHRQSSTLAEKIGKKAKSHCRELHLALGSFCFYYTIYSRSHGTAEVDLIRTENYHLQSGRTFFWVFPIEEMIIFRKRFCSVETKKQTVLENNNFEYWDVLGMIFQTEIARKLNELLTQIFETEIELFLETKFLVFEHVAETRFFKGCIEKFREIFLPSGWPPLDEKFGKKLDTTCLNETYLEIGWVFQL